MKNIAFVGCGDISGIYLENLTNRFSGTLKIAGICDLIPEKAQKRAEQFGVAKIYANLAEILADPTVDIVLNITRPYEHFGVSKAALMAGKNVYCEKPLGASLEEGIELVKLAKEKGLLIGGAPDTFLGAGIQTCRKLIDDGFIGEIVGTSAFMVCRGHESWHPDPEFYYKRGGGPMFDMGPYYLSALINLAGPIKSVTGMTRITFPTRKITSKAHYGEIIEVESPTNVAGIMEFENGAIGTIYTTFDVFSAEVPRIEIYGSKGTLSVPDPNTFGGPVKLFRPESGGFKEMPLMFANADNSRGLGLCDMARHLEEKTPFRASSDLTFHVLEIMTAFPRSAESRAFCDIKSRPSRPAPLEP